MKQKTTMHLVFSAFFLALALVLPFLTGQIPQIGAALSPMHLPALLCGFVCGWQWGMVVGFIAPLFRSALFSMPPMFPTALCMAMELAVYGAVSGLCYRKFPKKKPFIYVSLLIAMLAGRIVWGLARFLCTGLNPSAFGLSAFWAGAFANAVPGIIVQLILVPLIVMAVEKVQKAPAIK